MQHQRKLPEIPGQPAGVRIAGFPEIITLRQEPVNLPRVLPQRLRRPAPLLRRKQFGNPVEHGGQNPHDREPDFVAPRPRDRTRSGRIPLADRQQRPPGILPRPAIAPEEPQQRTGRRVAVEKPAHFVEGAAVIGAAAGAPEIGVAHDPSSRASFTLRSRIASWTGWAAAREASSSGK